MSPVLEVTETPERHWRFDWAVAAAERECLAASVSCHWQDGDLFLPVRWM